MWPTLEFKLYSPRVRVTELPADGFRKKWGKIPTQFLVRIHGRFCRVYEYVPRPGSTGARFSFASHNKQGYLIKISYYNGKPVL